MLNDSIAAKGHDATSNIQRRKSRIPENIHSHNSDCHGVDAFYTRPMGSEPRPPRRITIALRNDLQGRVAQAAANLNQNSNYFVNQCVEGLLDAIEGEDISHDIPVFKLARVIKGKPILDAKWVTALCCLLAPDTDELPLWHRRYFAELMNKHEGKLTHDFIRLYFTQAAEMDRHRTESDKQVARLKKAVSHEK
jgi:hypothetical protein